MSTDTELDSEFSVAEARAIVKDLFEPKLSVYWTDFLLSVAIGDLGLFLLMFDWPLWGQVIGYVIAVLALYRAVLFIHELVHLKSKAFVPFRIAWNVICGIPCLIPSYMYYTHAEHHSRKNYGTKEDGEYLPLAARPVWFLVWYMVQSVFVPVLLVARFLIMAPLSWLIPPFRRLLHKHLSSMVMDFEYVRPFPTNSELRIWRLQEVSCFLILVGASVLLWNDVISWVMVGKLYLVNLGVVVINQVRTLGAHRFQHTGRELTFLEQLLDSLNYPNRPWLTGLWAPVGLRYHALHHLFPAMPYHSLDEAHWRLMAQLPADSPYRQTNRSSLLHSLKELIVSSWNSQRKPRATNQEVERSLV